MAWLLGAAGGGAAAGAAEGAAAGSAGAGAATAIPAGNTAAGGIASGTGMLANPGVTTPPTGPFGQPKWAWDSVLQSGLSNLLSPKPLPSPTAGASGQPMQMQSLPPMTGLQGNTGGDNSSAYAPFLQALARSQGANKFGASPYGFGVPGAYFQ